MPLVSDTPVGNRFIERHTEGIVPGMIPQPFLIFEKRTKGDCDMQVLIAFVSRRKCPRIAQYIAPQFHKFIQAVESLDAGIDGTY